MISNEQIMTSSADIRLEGYVLTRLQIPECKEGFQDTSLMSLHRTESGGNGERYDERRN